MSPSEIAQLGKIVNEYDQLEVEDYQRVYVWQPEDIDLLFDDLRACANDFDGPDHFFGTLILQSESKEKLKIGKVVDGQQRLTTTFLIVAALRDAIDPKVQSLSKQGSRRQINVYDKAQDYLTFNKDDENFRLLPNRLLRKIMFKSVYPNVDDQEDVPWGQAKGSDKPTTLNLDFRRAILHIRSKVAAELADLTDPDIRLSRINLLLDVIIEKFRVLEVPTKTIDESLNIFLTLNSRGQELKASDLARGEILKGLGAGLLEEKKLIIHQENLLEWNEVSERVGDPEVFLRHNLVASENISVTKKTMLKEVVKKLTPEKDSADTELTLAKDFWKKLMDASSTYQRILTPSMGGRAQAYLEMLNELMDAHKVLFLNVIEHVSDSKQFEEICRLTCVLSYRWRLNGENAQQLEDFYREVGHDFSTSKDFKLLCESLKKKTLGLSDVSAKRWKKDQDSGAYTRALLYMIYFELHGRSNKWSLSDFHLEHIAPKARTDWWVKEALGLSSTKDIDDDDWKSFISAAGNLTLLDPGINMKVKNIQFKASDSEKLAGIPDKVSEYDKSVVRFNKELADFPTWNSEIVEQRTQWLIEMFEILWAVEPTSDRVRTFSEWLDESPV